MTERDDLTVPLDPSTPGAGDPGPQRSALAAALLNLTGLGVGYAYLGHRIRAVLAAALTVVLVIVAFATDAASSPVPWRVLAVVVLLGAAVDAWRLGRPRGSGARPAAEQGRRPTRPVLVALVVVAVVVAGYLAYGAAGRSVYADARAAQARADCPTATNGFDLVTGIFELTLSRDVPAAAVLRAECEEYVAVQQAQAQNRYPDAVAGYREFRSAHPQSLLLPTVGENLRRTYDSWATALRRNGDQDRAIGVYRDLLAETGQGPERARVRADLAATYTERASATRTGLSGLEAEPLVDGARSAVGDLLLVGDEFPETPSAATAPQGIVETYTAANRAFAEQRFCDALPVLRYFVTLVPGAATGGVVDTANADRSRALLECGLGRFRGGNPQDAIEPLEELATTYPDDPGTPQARSAVISAKVAVQTGETLPVPAPLGDDTPGSIPVTFFNYSPYEITVRMAGPTAHEFVLPACEGCPTYGLDDPPPACPRNSDKPSRKLQLRPGEHVDAITGPPGVDPSGGERGRNLNSSTLYWSCHFVRSGNPWDTAIRPL